MILGLSYNHPRPRWEFDLCLSKRAPPAEVPCMGNQPVAQRAPLAPPPHTHTHTEDVYSRLPTREQWYRKCICEYSILIGQLRRFSGWDFCVLLHSVLIMLWLTSHCQGVYIKFCVSTSSCCVYRPFLYHSSGCINSVVFLIYPIPSSILTLRLILS